MSGKLIAYKKAPAELLGQCGNKFEINTNSIKQGQTKLKVRQKDFNLLHPNYSPITSSDKPHCVNDEILSLLSEGEVSIEELSQWVFNDYTPQTAWQVYELTQACTYCYWQGQAIVVRSPEQAHKILAKQQAEILEITQRQACVERLKNKTFLPEDKRYLQEIVKVALNQSKHSKTLAQLGVDNTLESAYQILLTTGYYEAGFNPYPARHKAPHCDDFKDKQGNNLLAVLPKDRAIERLDLTHLSAYAIDNADTTDCDDALSVDNKGFWVHIADVGAFIAPSSPLDELARMRSSNLYLPDQVLSMLPNELVKTFSLGGPADSLAFSIYFELDFDELESDEINPEKISKINAIKLCHSRINVTNISYETAQDTLAKDPILIQLNNKAITHKNWRKSQGSIQLNLPKSHVKYKAGVVSFQAEKNTQARTLVAEWMVIAGRVIAQFARDNSIAMPFLSQEEANISTQIKQKQDTLSMAKQFSLVRSLKRSKLSIKPQIHSGMGLEAYIRSTSPLRRYLDLVTHQQLCAYLNNQPLLDEQAVKQAIKVNNTQMPVLNKINRQSLQHYQCLYFLDKPNWTGQAIVIDFQEGQLRVVLEQISMLVYVDSKENLAKNSRVMVRVSLVNLATLSLVFELTK